MLDHALGGASAASPAIRRSPPSLAASGGAWRSVGSCSPSPDLLLLDEPTNHLDAESVAWLERALADYRGTVIAVTHGPLLPRQRRRLDPRARSRQGHPVRGQLLLLARPEAAPARRRGQARRRAPTHAGGRARVGEGEPTRPPEEVEGAACRLRAAPGPKPSPRRSIGSRYTSRPGPDSATS